MYVEMSRLCQILWEFCFCEGDKKCCFKEELNVAGT